MSLFLHVRAGDYRFLIAADRVREVWRNAGTPAAAAEARAVDCRALFDAAPAEGGPHPVQVLVAGTDDVDTLLAVDDVVGMERLEQTDFRPFPAAGGGAAAALFDAVTTRLVGGLPLPRWSGASLP